MGSISTGGNLRNKLRAVPIHVRAEPGDYAEACLLPGDPIRAKYIAETYFDNPVQRNAERGLLGYTGEYEGRPVSVQATGMGCPTAAIVMEELVQLGVKRFLRVGTCGGLQHDLELGDLIVAISAVPADGTARHYVDQEPHCPTADWELVHGAVHAAKELDQPMRVGRDRVLGHVLRPRRRPPRALVGARRARGRDGGGGHLHARRAAQGAGRLPADRQRHRHRRRVHADLRRGPPGRRSTV